MAKKTPKRGHIETTSEDEKNKGGTLDSAPIDRAKSFEYFPGESFPLQENSSSYEYLPGNTIHKYVLKNCGKIEKFLTFEFCDNCSKVGITFWIFDNATFYVKSKYVLDQIDFT